MCIRDRFGVYECLDILVEFGISYLLQLKLQLQKEQNLAEYNTALISQDTAPVSYTHLDVYKRQVSNSLRTLRNFEPALHQKQDNTLKSDGKTTCRHIDVSYTHLNHLIPRNW